MRSRLRAVCLSCLVAVAAGGLVAPRAHAQVGTNFTYQGELQDGGVSYTGSADLRLRLFQDATSPAFLSGFIVRSNVACIDGRFTTDLDFGFYLLVAGAHLQIEVRTPHDPTDSLPYTLLSPRQPLTPTPQAQLAELARTADFAFSANTASNATNASSANNANALAGLSSSFYRNASNLNAGTLPSAQLSGTYSLALGFTNPGNAFAGSGAGLSALNAGNVSTGTLSPARGGTGSSVASAVNGQVLKWNGSIFTPQDDLDTNTTYNAGVGLTLASTTFSIPINGVTSAMLLDGAVSAQDIGASQVNNSHLASDAASLSRVSGTIMRSEGGNIGIGSITPLSTLHLQTATPVLAVQSSTNGGDAQIDLTETVGGAGVGGRLHYDGSGNTFTLGTVNAAGGSLIAAITVNRGSPDASFADDVAVPGLLSAGAVVAAGNVNAGAVVATGNVSAASFSIPTTTRSLSLGPASFIPSSNSSSYLVDPAGLQNASGAGVQISFYAPVTIPDDATITGFTFRCLDDDPSVDMTVELHQVTLSSGTDSVTAVTTSAGSAVLRTFSSGALSLPVDSTLRTYTVRATWAGPLPTANRIKLLSVRVDYTVTSPLP
ncbi:MAG: hypothetical protein ACKVS8_10275 [Phycisphaerales bacterium]